MVGTVIYIHGGYKVLIDSESYKVVSNYKWHIKDGYAVASVYDNGKTKNIRMHRLIFNINTDRFIDHIDGNKLNNRKTNLRECSHSQNIWNSKISKNKKSSKYKGVYWRKDRNSYISKANYNKKVYWLGSYKDEVEAAKAYDNFAKDKYREFARLNFPKKECN